MVYGPKGTLGTRRQRVVLVENAVSRVTTLLPVTKVFIVALLRESGRQLHPVGLEGPSGGGRSRYIPSGRRAEPAWGHAAYPAELLGSFPPLVAPRCTGHTWGRPSASGCRRRCTLSVEEVGGELSLTCKAGCASVGCTAFTAAGARSEVLPLSRSMVKGYHRRMSMPCTMSDGRCGR
jgi:hypothetical protein